MVDEKRYTIVARSKTTSESNNKTASESKTTSRIHRSFFHHRESLKNTP